jgi:hypothetical protein
MTTPATRGKRPACLECGKAARADFVVVPGGRATVPLGKRCNAKASEGRWGAVLAPDLDLAPLLEPLELPANLLEPLDLAEVLDVPPLLEPESCPMCGATPPGATLPTTKGRR